MSGKKRPASTSSNLADAIPKDIIDETVWEETARQYDQQPFTFQKAGLLANAGKTPARRLVIFGHSRTWLPVSP